MITKSDWDKLTPQQQWDQYCLLVSECGDSDEVDDAKQSEQLTIDLTLYSNLSAAEIQSQIYRRLYPMVLGGSI